MCLVVGIQRAGRWRAPDGYRDGLGTTPGPGRMDRSGSDRRPSHPPDSDSEFQGPGGTNALEHGSCHVCHHALMSIADVPAVGLELMRSQVRCNHYCVITDSSSSSCHFQVSNRKPEYQVRIIMVSGARLRFESKTIKPRVGQLRHQPH
jgi:hypothetical protein